VSLPAAALLLLRGVSGQHPGADLIVGQVPACSHMLGCQVHSITSECHAVHCCGVCLGMFAWAMWVQRKLRQCMLTTWRINASQSAWNAAWIGMDFVLDSRWVPGSEYW
jgi:hypothetical protein